MKICTASFYGRYNCRSTLLAAILMLNVHFVKSQCSILDNAIPGISYTFVQGAVLNSSGVASNPNFNVYYAVEAGNPIFPYETFDPSGSPLYQTNAGFDFRGLWWNPNTNEVEGNGYYTYGLWTSNLDGNGYALNTGTTLFSGQHQPSDQSCGDYDYDANEIVYYYNGSIYRYDRNTDALLGSYALTGVPVPLSNLNWTSVIYTGCCGNEIGVEDYVNKDILLFNKATGAYSGTSHLPASAATNDGFRLSYANNMVWLFNTNANTWNSYTILTGTAGNSVDLGPDTTLCQGSTLLLSAGSSSFQYSWSTGATDSAITVSSAGTYWLTVTSGNCTASDTIVITDTICAPPIAFIASDTAVCEKFCINFSDSSNNNPTAWQWYFPGGVPSSSTLQDPMNICYNDSGTYDVTLITTTANGNDTLTLTNYVTVYSTPSIPTITQNGYQLTASPGSAYQWQLNAYDIPGATNQTYDVMQTGLYTVIVYDEHGCKNSASVYVQIVGINEASIETGISVFPNPNNGSFIIDFSGAMKDETVLIRIENAIGQVIYDKEQQVSAAQSSVKIKMPDASDGVYFLELRTDNGNSQSKFMIER